MSICRLLYGSGLMGWWTIIPLTYYSHSTEYIASGICVHLQIIKWFRFNGLVDNHPLTYYSHSTEYIASGICVHLQIINIAIQLNTLQMGYVSTCRLLYGSGLMGWWTIIPLPTIAIQLNTLQVGYVSTCRLLT